MKSNPIITDEMLAAYLAGNASKHETALILRAIEQDSSIRETLRIMAELESEEDANVLPLLAMAADDCDKANRCAIKCEAYVLRKLGVNVCVDELSVRAEEMHYTGPLGTPVYNIGRLCEEYGPTSSYCDECTIEDIVKSLEAGKQVIAVVDTSGDGVPNHTIVVTSVRGEKLFIYDPDTEEEINSIDSTTFLLWWKASLNYMILISDKRHFG